MTPGFNSSRFHTEYMPSNNMHSSQQSNWYSHSSDTDSMTSSNDWLNGTTPYSPRQPYYHHYHPNQRKRLLTPDTQLESPMLPSPSTPRPPSQPNPSLKNHQKIVL